MIFNILSYLKIKCMMNITLSIIKCSQLLLPEIKIYFVKKHKERDHFQSLFSLRAGIIYRFPSV